MPTRRPESARRVRQERFAGVELPARVCGLTCCGAPLVALNALLALFHTLLGVVTFAVGDVGLRAQLYRPVADLIANTTWLAATGVAPRGSLYLTVATGMFFLLSAFFHAGNATLWRRAYLAGVRWCFTPSRWIEYTFSAGLMAVLIAYSSGMVMLDALVAVFALTSVTMFFGYLTELVARPLSADRWSRPLGARLQPHLLGYVPQIVVWYLILAQFYTVAADTTTVPAFVYSIVWGELILFWSFGVVQLVVTILPPRYYPYGEVAYQFLSLVSKGLLGILLLANLLRP